VSYWRIGLDGLQHWYALLPTGRGTSTYSWACRLDRDDAEDEAEDAGDGRCKACVELEENPCSD
jgi:hypothetical protein